MSEIIGRVTQQDILDGKVKPGRYPARPEYASVRLIDLEDRVSALERAFNGVSAAPPSVALWKSEVERLKLDRADQANTIIDLLQEKGEMAAIIADLRESLDNKSALVEAMETTENDHIKELKEKFSGLQDVHAKLMQEAGEQDDLIASIDADAKLGAMVRKMPMDWGLHRFSKENWTCSMDTDRHPSEGKGRMVSVMTSDPGECIQSALNSEEYNRIKEA